MGGDAGIGKSRLLREFLDQTGKSRGRVAVGRCRSFAKAPYEPLAELLATLAPGAALLVPARTLDAQLKSLADAFLDLAQKHAIVAIIEDLHWSDSATLAVLGLLAERLATSRMLLVATYRSNELSPEHPNFVDFGALQRSRSVASVVLGPLNAQETRDLIDATLSNAPGNVGTDVRGQVAHITEGNPFFTEELLKSVVDRQQSQQSDRSLPTTVHAAILEHMRPLTPSDQAVLTQAAVIGRQFDANLLAHTLETDMDGVLPVLQRARALQIVEETPEPTAFRFRHALTREAIYDRLLTAQRRPLHRRIALTLEAQAAWGAAPDALAYHWWAAGDRAKALEYGERGGDAAQALHGYADSIACYERVLTLLDPNDRDAARVRAKMGTSYFRAGSMDRAIEHFRAAWTFFRTTTDDANFVLRLARFLAAALYNDGHTRESTVFFRQAVETVVRCGDRRASERARLTFATYLIDSGEIEETREVLAAIDAELLDDDIGLTIAYWQTSCRVSALQGDAGGVRRAAERLCAIGGDPADPPASIEAYAESGISALMVGEMATARTCLHQAVDTCVALGLTASRGDLLVECALERVLSGALEEARALVVTALPLIGEGKLGRHRAILAALAAGTALEDRSLLAHEPDAGQLERVFETDLPLVYGPLAALCAQLQAARGEHAVARRLLRRAMRAARGSSTAFGTFPLAIVAAQHVEAADAAGVRALCARAPGGGPVSDAAANLAEAVLQRRFGEPEAARRSAERAAEGFAAIGWPVYEALARETAGDAAGAQRIREGIGYRGIAGGRLGPGQGAGQTELTPRELEIARLVAAGGSNRAIAAELNVSVKLIEKHLSSIYAKLALTSRSQLTARIIADERG